MIRGQPQPESQSATCRRAAHGETLAKTPLMARLGCMATSATRVEHTCYFDWNELEGVVGNHSPTGKVAGGRQTTAALALLLGRGKTATLAVSLYQRTSIIKSIVFNFRLLATPNHNQTITENWLQLTRVTSNLKDIRERSTCG